MKSFIVAIGAAALAVGFAIPIGATAPISSEHTFGAYLRRELEARGWSVRYLALRSGVNHSTISRLLHGRSPKLETLRRLQDVLMSQTARASMEIEGDDWLTDPVRAVAAALAHDPLLDPQRADEVLRYYLARRVSAAPHFQPERLPPAASIRRIRNGQAS